MRRIMLVLGTRPEAIKLAPVAHALVGADGYEPIVVSTAQHREMLDQVLELFQVQPDHDLKVGQPRQQLATLTARALERLTPLLESEQPDAVVVQGDTTTTVTGALSAFYAQLPVVHLEAGLRTGDPLNPFPEEMNRRVTTRIADLHLAATQQAQANLIREGVPESDITVTGNTVIDALLWAVEQQRPVVDPLLQMAEAHEGRVLLWTAHRRESWGAPLARVARSVVELARRYDDLLVILPAHRNPIVRETLLPIVAGVSNVLVGEPVDYWTFSRLMSRADLLLTDSGGVQEEGPSLGKPVLVTRDTTERVEAVEAGVAVLVGTQPERIINTALVLLEDDEAYAAMAQRVNPYGDGRAAARVVDALDRLFDKSPAGAERRPDWLPTPSRPADHGSFGRADHPAQEAVSRAPLA